MSFAAAARSSSIPADGVYPCLPALIAAMPASWMLPGVGKSGCPMQNDTMSLPCRTSAFTSARTTNAFSVPSDSARRESFAAVTEDSRGTFTCGPASAAR